MVKAIWFGVWGQLSTPMVKAIWIGVWGLVEVYAHISLASHVVAVPVTVSGSRDPYLSLRWKGAGRGWRCPRGKGAFCAHMGDPLPRWLL